MAVEAQVYPENLCLPMGGPQNRVVNPVTPLEAGFCFTPLLDIQHSLFYQRLGSQSFGFDRQRGISSAASSYSSPTCSSVVTMPLSQSLDVQLEIQRQEIGRVIQLQSERLRSTLLGERKQQLTILLKTLESKVSCLIRQKELDLAAARKKKMELEACLRRAEEEGALWRRLAKENETMVMGLSNTLEQVKENMVMVSDAAEDAESLFCGSCDREEQEVKGDSKKIACKLCNSRSSCVLFLPCRHLCSCKSCEAFLGYCPVCNSVKEATMEVFWV